MGRVYLIGVDHAIQHNGFVVGQGDEVVVDPQKVAAAIRDLQEYLRQQVEVTRATVLAEEFSKDALAKNRATMSSVAQVAQDLGIKHLFCDPGEAERERLGIDTCDKRENHWAARLAPFMGEDILFVCGDKHVATFPEVLKRHGMNSCVLSQGRGRDLIPMCFGG